ncbi:hypothetical protein [Sphingobacterium hungaricum]|uniref:Uncharacterized protein n=1 Tax=Sphingobacterium hungaricum TaxID=2082723 RepID=A0A928UW48_9SPHI|nr:hypothetical protein [Sphingobacterium hungaricum]MBE8714406.1 hypothetical protein [Sphingobacterium hungaricum]
MVQRKPYNPHTKYGRRKLQEQHNKRMAEMPKEERDEINGMTGGCFLLFIVVGGIIVYLLFGGEGLLKWLGGKRPY